MKRAWACGATAAPLAWALAAARQGLVLSMTGGLRLPWAREMWDAAKIEQSGVGSKIDMAARNPVGRQAHRQKPAGRSWASCGF